MATTVKVLNLVAALGADAVVSNGNLNVLGLTIPVKNIRPSSSITAYAAGTLQITTITPAPSNSAFYSVNVQGLSSIDNRIKLWNVQFTSAVSATATTICNQIRAQLGAYQDFPYTLSGTATCIITGVAGNNLFTVAADAASVGAFTSITTGTPAVQAVGAGTLIAAGNILPLSTDTQIVTTNNYTTVKIDYIDNAAVETRNTVHAALNTLYLFVNQGDADYISLTSAYGTIAQALVGKAATWTASTGDPVVANGVITLTTDVFYGNSDTNVGLIAGDVVYVATAPYLIASVLTATTANTPSTPNDATGAAGWYVKVRAV